MCREVTRSQKGFALRCSSIRGSPSVVVGSRSAFGSIAFPFARRSFLSQVARFARTVKLIPCIGTTQIETQEWDYKGMALPCRVYGESARQMRIDATLSHNSGAHDFAF